LISSYLITFWALFWIAISIVTYFICFTLTSILWPSENDYAAMMNMSTFPETYFFFVFFCSGYVLLDSGIHYLGIEINAWYWRRLEKFEKEQQIIAKKDETTIRRKVTLFKTTGFAFSQERGHDLLVTDSLATRIQKALATQIAANAFIDVDGTQKTDINDSNAGNSDSEHKKSTNTAEDAQSPTKEGG